MGNLSKKNACQDQYAVVPAVLLTVAFSQTVSGSSIAIANSAYSYDGDSNLKELTYYQNSTQTTPINDYQWVYDADSRVTTAYSMGDASGTPTFQSTSTYGKATFTYDDNSELTATSYSTYGHPPTTNLSESYDQNGNRTSARLYPVRWR